MGAAAWAESTVGAVVLLCSGYLTLLCGALRNEHVIGGAIVAMRTAQAAGSAPQRVLIREVADALAAQEHAAAQIELTVHEAALGGDRVPAADVLLRDLLELPEPQLLITDFLREHAGGPGSDAAFTSAAADMVRTATIEAFGDLADQGLAELGKLLVLADKGRIADVALASLSSSLDPNPPSRRIPQPSNLDPAAITAVARALDWSARRQLRLATLLHGQAEAMLRLPSPGERGPAAAWLRLRALLRFPLPRRPDFRSGDLEQLAQAFGYAGEVLSMAREHLAGDKPALAAHLLAGLCIPVPAGLPGRMYQQESLAQVRPLARIAAWHRLAVCRWTASALEAIARRDAEKPDLASASARSPECGALEGDRS